MTSANIQDIILKETNQLPLSIQSEVLDFVLFLKNKYTGQQDSNKVSLSLLQENEIAHLEDEFANYKTRYPHE